ncbi:MAG: GTPase HflX [bacterium]
MNRATIDFEKEQPQSVILYGFIDKKDDGDLDEFSFLAESAGVLILEAVAQRKNPPNPRHYIAPSSVKELSELVELVKPDLVIFDCELKGSQRNHLEDDLKIPVLDRTELILDIFASRAKTKEGKLQVELAQLMYQLPRLAGLWKHFGALGGGIGTRGPGETQLEVDRRRVNQKITQLKRQIKTVQSQRNIQRKSRMQSKAPKISLVGYTNAGKSTLLNALTKASAYTDDRLFATLDTLTRKGYFTSSNREFLMTDTVGFIRRIPTQLIAAFEATLEEIRFSDLLLIVVDITDDDHREKLDVVNSTLDDIGAGDLPKLVVYNKADLLDGSEPIDPAILEFSVSAKRGDGLKILLEKLDSMTLRRVSK